MKERGVAEKDTILVTAFFALGMLLFSNVAGKLGDKYGHLAVMRNLSAIGFLCVASFVFLSRFSLMCATGVRGGRHARVDLAGLPRAAGAPSRSATRSPGRTPSTTRSTPPAC
jgi:MFS family permease